MSSLHELHARPCADYALPVKSAASTLAFLPTLRPLPPLPLDAAGGAALNAPTGRMLRLAQPDLRCLDLIDAAELERLDLSRLQADVHLTLRGCSNLRRIDLPPDRHAHVHVDGGDAPPDLQLTGGVEQVDACWGSEGRLLERAPRGGAWHGVRLRSGAVPNLHGLNGDRPTQDAQVGANAPPIDCLVIIGLRPQHADRGDATVQAPAGMSTSGQVSIVAPDATLRHLTWRGGAVQSLSVMQALGLETLEVSAPVESLNVHDCPALRAVITGERVNADGSLGPGCTSLADLAAVNDVTKVPDVTALTAITDVSIRGTSLRPAASKGAARKREALILDLACKALTLADIGKKRVQVSRPCKISLNHCIGLMHLRTHPGCVVDCVGHVPLNLLDQHDARGLTMQVDEGMLQRLRQRVVQGHPAAWQRMHRAMRWSVGPQACVAALEALRGLHQAGVPVDELWQARQTLRQGNGLAACASTHAATLPSRRMLQAHPRETMAREWSWNFRPDLSVNGYRADFELWLECRETPSARWLTVPLARSFLRGWVPEELADLWPWLVQRMVPGAAHFAAEVMTEGKRHALIDHDFRKRFEKSLPWLLQHLAQSRQALLTEAPGLDDILRAFVFKHGTGDACVQVLAARAAVDRPATQAWIAKHLSTVAGQRTPENSRAIRSALTTLMLTGRLPADSAWA